MFESDSDFNNSPSQNNNTNNSYVDYLRKASQASEAGDEVLGLHLYLAAYERAAQGSDASNPAVINGLRKAWQLACSCKERSLAEYIFEKLEPFLSSDEIAQCAAQLQRLALDKLEEFGLSREDLEDMTDMISQDFFGMNPDSYGLRVEKAISSTLQPGLLSRGLVRSMKTDNVDQEADEENQTIASQEDVAHEQQSDSDIAQTDVADLVFAVQEQEAEAPAITDAIVNSTEASLDQAFTSTNDVSLDSMKFGLVMPSKKQEGDSLLERMTYNDLIGYETVIDVMRKNGVGVENDPDYRELVKTLNLKHGLTKVPITDIFLFRSAEREDANQFMMATLGEVNLPAIRMRMEENLQGMPVLVVMASSERQSRFSPTQNPFEGGGVLVLEDIDLWGSPLAEMNNEESNALTQVQLSRGAREALNLIRTSVENPDVYVLVSATQESSIDSFLLELLEPLTVVDIALPNEQERCELWINIVREHPSLRAVNRAELVKYSAGISRYDIYMAAREAVEEAYKMSLSTRRYVPVTTENIYEKIAAYQPLDSEEYRQMEDAVIEGFSKELEGIDEYFAKKKDG